MPAGLFLALIDHDAVAARGRNPRKLGSRRIEILAGKTSTVKVRLAKRNRRKIKPGGLKALVEVDLGSAGKVTRKVTLRRGPR